MSTETGRWLQSQGLKPDQVIVTPTLRTQQTAEELLLVFSDRIPTREIWLPELMEDWEALMDSLEAEFSAEGVALLVGHHPTMDMLKRDLGPMPVTVPRGNFAAAVVLESSASGWRCIDAWPGRSA